MNMGDKVTNRRMNEVVNGRILKNRQAKAHSKRGNESA